MRLRSCKTIAGAARRAHSACLTLSYARRRGRQRPCWPRSDRVSALERGSGFRWLGIDAHLYLSLPSRRSKLGSDSPLSTFETGAWCAARIMRGTRYPILTASVACICARTGEKWKSGARAGPEPGGRAWAKGSSGVAEHLGTAGPCSVRQSVDEHRLSYRRAVHGWRRLRHRWAVPRPLHPWLLGGHV